MLAFLIIIPVVSGLWGLWRSPSISTAPRPGPSGKPRQKATYFRFKGINAKRRLSSKKKSQIKSRFGNICVFDLSKDNVQVEHIIPVYDGGTDEDSNLFTLCRKCNENKKDLWTFTAKQLVHARNETAEINGNLMDYTKEENTFIQHFNETEKISEPYPWFLINRYGEPILIKDFSFQGMTGLKALSAFYAALDKNHDHYLNSWKEAQAKHNPLFKKELSSRK